MHRFYALLARSYFIFATVLMMVLAVLLLGFALWEMIVQFQSEDRIEVLLDTVGIVIIGFAIVETAKFIAEEEVVRTRELRSSKESRRSITKFVTIIVIAASLEALVMVFKTNRQGIELAIYPAALFVSAMLALVALGLYQWLSSRIDSDDD